MDTMGQLHFFEACNKTYDFFYNAVVVCCVVSTKPLICVDLSIVRCISRECLPSNMVVPSVASTRFQGRLCG